MNPAMARDVEPWCELARCEFREMPGLRLTRTQAQRLWGFAEWTSSRVLQKLVDDHFLIHTHNDQFCRADQIDGPASID